MQADSVIIDGVEVKLPSGLECTNYTDRFLECRFKTKKRKKPLKHIVLHETAGNTAKGCKRTLLKKGYGIHFVLDRNGKLSNHADLATETVVHANQLNKTSIGIEVVNPYAPKTAKYTVKTIPAKWWTWLKDKKDKRYVLPTDAQLETLTVLLPWLCEQLNIPYAFPTWYLNRRQKKIKFWRLRAKPEAGIVAHRDFHKHADGRYLLEYVMLANLPITDFESEFESE